MKFLKNYQSYIFLIIAVIFGSGVGVFTKIGLQEIPPLTFTFLRFLIVAVIFIPLYFILEKPKRDKDIRKLLLVSLGAVWNVTFFTLWIAKTSAISGQVLYAFVPILTAILSIRFFKDRFSNKKILGMWLGFLWTLAIVFLPLIYGNNLKIWGITWNLIILAAMLSFTFYTVFSKPLQKKYSPLMITTCFVTLTTIILWILSIFELQHNTIILSKISFQTRGSLLFVWLLGTGVYYLLHQLVIKKLSSIHASLMLYLQPIFVLGRAIPILNEKLTIPFIAASLLTLTGLRIFQHKKQ